MSEEKASTLTGLQLEALTGLTDRRVRQIAKQGYFPAPINGVYQMSVTIRGMFKYYHENRGEKLEVMQDAKLSKLQAEAEMAQIKLATTKGDVISLPEKIEFMKIFAAKLNQLLIQKLETEVPARLVGKGIVEARKEARMVHDEIWDICNANIMEWNEK